MRQRVKVATKIAENQEKPVCHHYWVIEVANGPSSVGKCKYCGETKEFLNAFPVFNPLRKNGSPLKLPKLPDVEMEKGSAS